MLELQREDALFVIRMNAGENRFTLAYFAELHRLLDQVLAEATTGGAVLIAAEGKFWSNGIDLDWLRAASPGEQGAFTPSRAARCWRRPSTFE